MKNNKFFQFPFVVHCLNAYSLYGLLKVELPLDSSGFHWILVEIPLEFDIPWNFQRIPAA